MESSNPKICSRHLVLTVSITSMIQLIRVGLIRTNNRLHFSNDIDEP